jgi:hypothetical protein
VGERSHDTEHPRAAIRRIVGTSKGLLLLEINHLIGSLSISTNAFDDEGWEERSRRLSWIEEGSNTRARNYHEQGGRDSVADAIEQTTGVSRGEADRIAAETLLDWASHISDEEIAESERVMRFVIASLIIVALFIAGFVALLVLVVVTLAF